MSFETDPTRQVKHVPFPEYTPLSKADLFDDLTGLPDHKLLKKHLMNEGKLEKDCATHLLQMTGKVLQEEDNMLKLQHPLIIVGDIHGQYYDLLEIFKNAGSPSRNSYLFLGDYVDRGVFGTEVVFYLFALKLNFPSTFHLLRGNHECRLLTTHFNFRKECEVKYPGVMGRPRSSSDPDIRATMSKLTKRHSLNMHHLLESSHSENFVFNEFMSAFDCLPISALISNNKGKYLCMHGGLSPHIKKVADIEKIKRTVEPPKEGALCDLLWSDPLEEETANGLSQDEMEEWYGVDYEPNPTRGCGYIFGYKAVKDFLEENGLNCIIRAHEVQKSGYDMNTFCHDDLEEPLVITVFSAPNYCDMYENQAGFMIFEENQYSFETVSWTPHPAYLPKFQNALDYSFQFMCYKISALCKDMVGNVEPGEDAAVEEIIRQIKSNPTGDEAKALRESQNQSHQGDGTHLWKYAKSQTTGPDVNTVRTSVDSTDSVAQKIKLIAAKKYISPNRNRVARGSFIVDKKMLKGSFQQKLKAYQEKTQEQKHFNVVRQIDVENEKRPEWEGFYNKVSTFWRNSNEFKIVIPEDKGKEPPMRDRGKSISVFAERNLTMSSEG